MAGASRPRRGATGNATSARFGLPSREDDGDWLDERDAIDGAPAAARTTTIALAARTIITRNTSPDLPFDRSINAYAGCEHVAYGCVLRGRSFEHALVVGTQCMSPDTSA